MALRVRWFRIIPTAAIAVSMLAACGQPQSSAGGGQTYKDQKSMVIDILKSDEGKKAIYSALSSGDTSEGGGSEGQDGGGGSGQSGGDSSSGGGGDQGGGGQGGGQGGGGQGGGSSGAQMLKMKTLNTKDTQMLKMTVQEVIADPNNAQFLKSMMTDPKFAGSFAKAIKDENKKLHMELIKDPEYQKQLLDVMKNPEFESILMDSMKTVKSRQQMRMVVQDTLQSPLFKAELVTLLKKAVEEHLKEPEKKGEKAGAKAKSEGGAGEGGGGKDQGGDQDKTKEEDKKESQTSQ